MGQLDQTQPATRLTRNPINPFKNDLFWPATSLTRKLIWPNPTHPFYHV